MNIKSEKQMFFIRCIILLKGYVSNFPDLLESLYSLEISQTLTTIKTGKDWVKSGCL